jgi:hypothetical protein
MSEWVIVAAAAAVALIWRLKSISVTFKDDSHNHPDQDEQRKQLKG